jgi:flagellar hook-associated protein 3 FlgL
MSISFIGMDYGNLDPILAATAQVKQNISQLTEQTASGYLAQDYAGLGEGASQALDLTSEIAANTTLQANTQSAGTVASAAQSALGQIESIASNFTTQLDTLENSGTSGSSVQTIAAQANDALQQVAQLLNTQVGGTYVFAGQDSTDPPIPNAANITSSNFYTAINAAVAGLTTNGAPATEASTLAIASPGGTSPFSTLLDSAGAQSEVDLGGGTRVKLAPLANTNSDAQSAGIGTTSTGSYTRDIMMTLASIGSLTQSQSGDTNFLPFVQSAVTTLQGATTAINTDIGALGARQDQITTANTDLTQTATTLKGQLSNLQDADLTTVAASLSQAQTQLEASYQVISTLSQLSLTKFLPTTS